MSIFKKKQPNSADSNDAAKLIDLSNDEANNPTVQGADHSDKSLQRQKNESVQAYNERVPIGLQPVQPSATHSYLGKPL
jgi:hypothetical protein